MNIPVVDLFAGPGGLSEGFSRYADGRVRYDVVLSIEKDPAAHRSLELRSFFRRFPEGEAPDDYYRYLRGEITREELFARHPREAIEAVGRARRLELGVVPLGVVVSLIAGALDGARHWVLLGGPPCQAYSTIGRARMKSRSDFDDDLRHTLYREYLKIVAALRPTVFVMENVKGILSSRHRNRPVFDCILRDMRVPLASLTQEDAASLPGHPEPVRYRLWSFVREALCDEILQPADFVICAERYGVPQARHRVIILGIREDYDIRPGVLEPDPVPLTVGDVIAAPYMPPVRSRLSKGDADGRRWAEVVRLESRSVLGEVQDRRVRERMRCVLQEMRGDLEPGGRFIPGGAAPSRLGPWFNDPRLRGVIQHEARGHMPRDLARYLYASCYAEVHGVSPKLQQFPEVLWPDHTSVRRRKRDGTPYFSDRFRVQVAGLPASTVMAHLRADGHYFIHPDPLQCRSVTVREAARLQTFPDNYFFEGTRTEQYIQVGNAVPPYLAYQMAAVVADVLSACAGTQTRARLVA